MNEQERSELELLKRRHERLSQEFGLLSKQLEALEKRLDRVEWLPSQAAPQTPAAESKPPQTPQPTFKLKLAQPSPALPSIAIPEPPKPAVPAAPVVPKPTPVPASVPVPPIIRPSPIYTAPKPAPVIHQPQIATAPALVVSKTAAPEPAQTVPPSIPPIPPPVPRREAAAPEPPVRGSFELRLGTFWLVRVGIVLVLTGFVLAGGLAFQRFGAGGRVGLLYLGSGLLLGAGAWLQRKAVKIDSLRNYAQVLFAGGLAAVYFTTYAAHHFEKLRVIDSNWLDGILLLGWAGFMVWVADRKKSEVMALFAIVLAYYTAVVTNVGLFTLYSNLILTVAAVFFMVRNRWAILSFVSLSASYAAYGYWRFFYGHVLHFPSPSEELWTGTWFLAGYWVVFTAAVFLSRHEKFSGEQRASFLTINNGAFFAMYLLTMYELHSREFWKFGLIYGAVLLALAVLARFVLSTEPLAKNTYLTQGLLLATTGIIAHPRLAGLDLSLILAVESVTLMIAGQFRKNRVLLAGGYIAAAVSVGWGMNGMMQNDQHDIWRGVGLAGLMLFNAWWVGQPLRTSMKPVLRFPVSYFTVLALAVLFVITYNNTSHQRLSLWLAGEATLFVLSIYFFKIREFTLLGSGFLALAQFIWLFQAFTERLPVSPWNPTIMVVLTMGLTGWWKKQKLLDLRSGLDPDWSALEKLPTLMKSLVLLGAAWYGVQVAGNQAAPHPMVLWLPIWLGALMLGDALLAHRQVPIRGEAFRFQPAFSTLLALGTWLAVTWHQTALRNFPLALAVAGLALTFSIYFLRVPEVPRLAQGYIIIAQAVWLANYGIASRALPPWWNSAAFIGITLGLSHWWQRQNALETNTRVRWIWQGAYALALIGVLYYSLYPTVNPTVWLGLVPLLALVVTVYAVVTRAWLLAAFAQIFVLASGFHFASQLIRGETNWCFPLAPIAALALLAYGTVKWFQVRTDAKPEIRGPLLQLAMVYRWAGLMMSLWWVYKYIPARDQFWVFAMLGCVVFLWAGWRKNREALLFGGVFTAAGLVLFWSPLRVVSIVYWPNLGAILLLLLQQAMAKRLTERYQVEPRIQAGALVVGCVSLWMLLSRWVIEVSRNSPDEGGYLTASWCVLALVLFTAGILLRERIYRWMGLAILACGLGRVMLIDVWRLALIFRILSFMALGVVLIVLGFIYNKYQEKIKEWL